MNKISSWITIMLILIILVLIGINITDQQNNIQSGMINIGVRTYQSDYSDMVIYNSQGSLSYRLIAEHIKYFPDAGISLFINPVITTFNNKKIAIWLIKADRAKLMNDHILYLHGHVEANALTNNTQLRKIKMNNTKINLITQDIVSQDLVILYGKKFNASGFKMLGNLLNKNAMLIEKVKTSYEI